MALEWEDFPLVEPSLDGTPWLYDPRETLIYESEALAGSSSTLRCSSGTTSDEPDPLPGPVRKEDCAGTVPDWDRQGPSSQATAGSSGRSDPQAEPQGPLARQRELNRRAQVRFRQRQRARREAAMVQYQEVRASLEAARAEKRALARQNVLLARLLEHRDRSLGLLQSGAAEAPPSGLGLRRLKPCCLRSEDGFSPAQMALLHADCLYGSSNFFTMPGMALPPKDVQRMRELGPEPVLRMGYWLKQELASLIASLDVAYSSEKEARLNSVLATGVSIWRCAGLAVCEMRADGTMELFPNRSATLVCASNYY